MIYHQILLRPCIVKKMHIYCTLLDLPELLKASSWVVGIFLPLLKAFQNTYGPSHQTLEGFLDRDDILGLPVELLMSTLRKHFLRGAVEWL